MAELQTSAEKIDRNIDPEVQRQYEQNRTKLSGLEPGESKPIDQRLWARGEDGRLYYNSNYNYNPQGGRDKTYGCLSDSSWYVRESEGSQFTRVSEKLNGGSLNATYYVSGDNQVYDHAGNKITPDHNGVYIIRNPLTKTNEYITKKADGQFCTCSQNGTLAGEMWAGLTASLPSRPSSEPTSSPSSLVERPSFEPRTDSPQSEIHQSTKPLVRAQYEANQEMISALEPGKIELVGERAWVRGEDGKIYYNTQGESDQTYGCLSDPHWYIRNPDTGSFTQATQKLNGLSLNAPYFVSNEGKVYDHAGKEIKPGANGVYTLPNPVTNVNEYVIKDGDEFRTCSCNGVVAPGWEEQLGGRPSPEHTSETDSPPPLTIENLIREQERTHPETATPERVAPVHTPERALRQQRLAENTLRGTEEERLIDASRFLSDEGRQALERYQGLSDPSTGIGFGKTEQDGYSFAFSGNGETWYVSQSPFYRDQYPDGKTFSASRCVIWKAGTDGQVQREFLAGDVFSPDGSPDGSIDFRKVNSLMREAEANNRSQINNATDIQKLDLRGEPVGYIGLASGGRDPVIDGLREDLRTFPEMMNSIQTAGKPSYDFRVQGGSAAISVDRSPKDILQDKLSEMREQGIKTFYLNLAGHGNNAGVHFTTSSGKRYVLSGKELTGLFDEFSDCQFVVDTVACHGAGYADALADYKDHFRNGDTPRVVVKLQSKSDSVNQEGRIASGTEVPEPFSSYYNIFYNYYLQQGSSVGEAHLKADAATKRYCPCDAEVWVGTEQGGNVTKGLDLGLSSLRLPKVRRTESGSYSLA